MTPALRLVLFARLNRIAPETLDGFGQRTSRFARIGDRFVGCVGESQHRANTVVGHHDDKSHTTTLGVLTRRGVIVTVIVDGCRPAAGQHRGSIEHARHRATARFEQLIDISMLGKK